jgi:hypothetical protein
MARRTTASNTVPQNYPRIQDETSRYVGCLDDEQLAQHADRIPLDHLKKLIRDAIINANQKSSRAILALEPETTPEEIARVYKNEGRKLFAYFRRYCGDPASTAHQLYGKSYRDVANEQFRNRTLQKERMNSGWRYQFLATGCAQESGRFNSVSDIGNAECDFNAVVDFREKGKGHLTLYVSVKNRSNTMGGQDWPKAIQSLENFAKLDKNRVGPYCCVFGIAMDRGSRYIKIEKKSESPYSVNTEIWLSDFFWPFFANYSYEEIMSTVLDVLMESAVPDALATQLDVPVPLVESFGEACRQKGLINEQGLFHDPYKLVAFFCQL